MNYLFTKRKKKLKIVLYIADAHNVCIRGIMYKKKKKNYRRVEVTQFIDNSRRY